MRFYHFEIPGLPAPELSPNARVHWAARHRASSDYKDLVFFHAMNQLNTADATQLAKKENIALDRALLDLVFVFKTNRRRDRDNILSMFKPGLDAIRLLGLIADDSSQHLLIGSIAIEVDAARAPLTIIELKEIGNGTTASEGVIRGDSKKGGTVLPPGGSGRQHPSRKTFPQGYRHSGHTR